jgi:hypothetical protein
MDPKERDEELRGLKKDQLIERLIKAEKQYEDLEAVRQRHRGQIKGFDDADPVGVELLAELYKRAAASKTEDKQPEERTKQGLFTLAKYRREWLPILAIALFLLYVVADLFVRSDQAVLQPKPSAAQSQALSDQEIRGILNPPLPESAPEQEEQ